MQHVPYALRTTIPLTFRADEALAKALDEEAARSGTSRSQLLDRAVRELLYRLACERDAERYGATPLTGEEVAVGETGGWVDDAPGTDWEEVFGRETR